MKNIFWACLLLCACKQAPTNPPHQEETLPESLKNASQFVEDLEEASLQMKEFWGKRPESAIMVVDPKTRIFVGFTPLDNRFKIDTLPSELNIANTALDWNGKTWIMIMAPLPKDSADRLQLGLHERFHSLQASIGFGGLKESDNAHLDGMEGRMMLRMELEALRAALTAQDPGPHLQNAIQFREQRQLVFSAQQAENMLELNEGLAEYTGLMLSPRTDEERVQRLLSRIDPFLGAKSYVRSFAYQTLPIYGYFLQEQDPHWHKTVDMETKLTELLKQQFGWTSDSRAFEQICLDYGYPYAATRKQEETRDQKQKARLAELKMKLGEGKGFVLPFRQMQLSFDPGELTAIEGLGTVYPNLRISDEWGILEVSKDGLIPSNWSYVKVAEVNTISSTEVTGDGWVLKLNPGWKVVRTNMGAELHAVE